MVERNYEYKQAYISYDEYGVLITKLAKKIKKYIKANGLSPTCVYGAPRGGLPIAVHISHALGLPLSLRPQHGMLLVDDINDTGKTLRKYLQKYDTPVLATIIDRFSSVVVVDCKVLQAQDNTWYIFPWEKK